jgi:geranylgeranyl diphosphate synthase type I
LGGNGGHAAPFSKKVPSITPQQSNEEAVEVLDLIEERLGRAVDHHRGSSPVYGMIRYHFGYEGGTLGRTGKRLRPQLLLRVALEEGGAPESALDAAAAIEILHNYSLVHDDIEDGDRVRHGRATVWARDGVAHGINAGDAMCAISYLTLLANEANLPADRLMRMTRVLHEANLAMCEGQGLDIAFESLPHVTLEQYFEMIAGKTAALFAGSCELGALAAGADPARARAYAALGRAYGRAFQIRDDVLGTWGATELTGKPSGADIARRKWSFPVVWALASPSSADHEIVAAAYARGGALDAPAVAAVIAALERLGARDAADRLHDEALAEADRIAVEGSLDRGGSIRGFLAQGARRVA